MSDRDRAVRLLSEGYTCALVRGASVTTSRERGVAPLLDWIDRGVDLHGFCAADKVVGRAAALLYAVLGVKQVYAEVLSQGAAEVLERYGIGYGCGAMVPYIRNRANTGMCPVEQSVAGVEDADAAVEAIRRRLGELRTLPFTERPLER